jgi:hypothetical protein
MSDDREVRFGLRRGNERSGTYIVAGTPRADDVYITSRHVGAQYKVSLHQSGSWRMSVEPIDPATGVLGPPIGGETWSRPDPIAPGLTKVFAVLIPGGAIGTPLTPDVEARVRLVNLPPGAVGVQFTVFYAHPDVRGDWPGANAMRSTLVGRFTLPTSGERVFVVAHALDELPAVGPRSASGTTLPGFTPDDLRRMAADGNLRGILFGADDDGMRWFIDGRVVPR